MRKKKKQVKWSFRIANDWTFSKDFVNVELLSFHWENHARWVTIIGFSFILEKE